MSETTSHPSAADRDALVLLETTEIIHAALLGEGDLDALGSAYDRREIAFDALRSAGEDGEPPVLGPAARAAIQRVRALDEEILEVGWAQAHAIRDERQNLRRRRSVIQAHSARERERPRVVTVKV
ncbi:MAG: hypothetical protein AAGC67_11610 [Myxococcota bacterium]